MREVIKNVLIWLIFSFLLSIIPIFASVLKLYSVNVIAHDIYIDIKDVISHGELLIITIATLGIALGELFKSETKWKLCQIIIGGGALITFFLTTYFFTDISASKSGYDKNFVYNLSIPLILSSVIFTISSFILPKK
jgi:hypothetical protein